MVLIKCKGVLMKNYIFHMIFFVFLGSVFVSAQAGDGSTEMSDDPNNHYVLLPGGDETQRPPKISSSVPSAHHDPAYMYVAVSRQNPAASSQIVHKIESSRNRKNNPCTKLAKWCKSGPICRMDRDDWVIFGCGLTTVVFVPVCIYFAQQSLSDASL
jgi:hypothetical protein